MRSGPFYVGLYPSHMDSSEAVVFVPPKLDDDLSHPFLPNHHPGNTPRHFGY